MTFTYFLNCVALAVAPYVIAYRHWSLAEYGAFRKCSQAAGGFIGTFLVKMLVLATCFPSDDDAARASPPGFTPALLSLETLAIANALAFQVLRYLVEVIDLVGLLLILNRIGIRGSAQKFLTCAIGWGVAEIFILRLASLWIGARASEFDWKYLLLAVDANINLIRIVSLSALVWMLRRSREPNAATRNAIVVLIAVALYSSFIGDQLGVALHFGPAGTTASKAAIVLTVGLVTQGLYQSIFGSSNKNS